MSLPSPPLFGLQSHSPASAHLVHLKVSDVYLVEKGPDVSLHIPDPPPPAADPPLAEAARQGMRQRRFHDIDNAQSQIHRVSLKQMDQKTLAQGSR